MLSLLLFALFSFLQPGNAGAHELRNTLEDLSKELCASSACDALTERCSAVPTNLTEFFHLLKESNDLQEAQIRELPGGWDVICANDEVLVFKDDPDFSKHALHRSLINALKSTIPPPVLSGLPLMTKNPLLFQEMLLPSWFQHVSPFGTLSGTKPCKPHLFCAVYCPNGQLLDENGCFTCNCNPSPSDPKPARDFSTSNLLDSIKPALNDLRNIVAKYVPDSLPYWDDIFNATYGHGPNNNEQDQNIYALVGPPRKIITFGFHPIAQAALFDAWMTSAPVGRSNWSISDMVHTMYSRIVSTASPHPPSSAPCLKQPLCQIHCRFGFAVDENGCSLCKCNSASTLQAPPADNATQWSSFWDIALDDRFRSAIGSVYDHWKEKTTQLCASLSCDGATVCHAVPVSEDRIPSLSDVFPAILNSSNSISDLFQKLADGIEWKAVCAPRPVSPPPRRPPVPAALPPVLLLTPRRALESMEGFGMKMNQLCTGSCANGTECTPYVHPVQKLLQSACIPSCKTTKCSNRETMECLMAPSALQSSEVCRNGSFTPEGCLPHPKCLTTVPSCADGSCPSVIDGKSKQCRLVPTECDDPICDRQSECVDYISTIILLKVSVLSRLRQLLQKFSALSDFVEETLKASGSTSLLEKFQQEKESVVDDLSQDRSIMMKVFKGLLVALLKEESNHAQGHGLDLDSISIPEESMMFINVSNPLSLAAVAIATASSSMEITRVSLEKYSHPLDFLELFDPLPTDNDFLLFQVTINPSVPIPVSEMITMHQRLASALKSQPFSLMPSNFFPSKLAEFSEVEMARVALMTFGMVDAAPLAEPLSPPTYLGRMFLQTSTQMSAKEAVEKVKDALAGVSSQISSANDVVAVADPQQIVTNGEVLWTLRMTSDNVAGSDELRNEMLQSIQKEVWGDGLPSNQLNEQLKGTLTTSFNEILDVSSSYAIPPLCDVDDLDLDEGENNDNSDGGDNSDDDAGNGDGDGGGEKDGTDPGKGDDDNHDKDNDSNDDNGQVPQDATDGSDGSNKDDGDDQQPPPPVADGGDGNNNNENGKEDHPQVPNGDDKDGNNNNNNKDDEKDNRPPPPQAVPEGKGNDEDQQQPPKAITDGEKDNENDKDHQKPPKGKSGDDKDDGLINGKNGGEGDDDDEDRQHAIMVSIIALVVLLIAGIVIGLVGLLIFLRRLRRQKWIHSNKEAPDLDAVKFDRIPDIEQGELHHETTKEKLDESLTASERDSLDHVTENGSVAVSVSSSSNESTKGNE